MTREDPPVEVRRRTPLSTVETWRRLTTWERHAEVVPFTRVRRLSGSDVGAGTRFVARTAIGRLGFDDPMEVIVWEPPQRADAAGFCRLERRGHFLRGWAEIHVEACEGGSLVVWRERADVAKLGPLAGVPTRVLGPWLFGRVVKQLLERPS